MPKKRKKPPRMLPKKRKTLTRLLKLLRRLATLLTVLGTLLPPLARLLRLSGISRKWFTILWSASTGSRRSSKD